MKTRLFNEEETSDLALQYCDGLEEGTWGILGQNLGGIHFVKIG